MHRQWTVAVSNSGSSSLLLQDSSWTNIRRIHPVLTGEVVHVLIQVLVVYLLDYCSSYLCQQTSKTSPECCCWPLINRPKFSNNTHPLWNKEKKELLLPSKYLHCSSPTLRTFWLSSTMLNWTHHWRNDSRGSVIFRHFFLHPDIPTWPVYLNCSCESEPTCSCLFVKEALTVFMSSIAHLALVPIKIWIHLL